MAGEATTAPARTIRAGVMTATRSPAPTDDRDNDRAREQLEQARQAVNELLAKAQAKLDDLVKSNRGRD